MAFFNNNGERYIAPANAVRSKPVDYSVIDIGTGTGVIGFTGLPRAEQQYWEELADEVCGEQQ